MFNIILKTNNKKFKNKKFNMNLKISKKKKEKNKKLQINKINLLINHKYKPPLKNCSKIQKV